MAIPRVLITGCSSGIGRALAEVFQSRGCHVYATARRPETLDGLVGGRITQLPLDVTDPKSIASAVSNVLADGPLDVLVNNAGYGQIAPSAEIPIDVMRRQFETNVFGAMAVTQACIPPMVERRSGTIVNIGSISGILTTPFAGTYCASKAALHSLSEALRMELAPFGIKVVIVKPGGVTSRFGDNSAANIPLIDGSIYAPIQDAIEARARTSQHGGQPADRVAREIVEAVLRPNPPYIVACGRGGRKYPAYKRWIPERTLDAMLLKRFGLDRLSNRLRNARSEEG